ncbi:MAG: lipid A deacylase LpxR family protein [Verrucomicrobiales bacterium]|nr:lipid A deacylase LpxR family protein [Verrucomicrobiales bacterium]MCP5560520.1 lipid A deacylase LpxR family protein [Verrucomicrobiaceae bacterium]
MKQLLPILCSTLFASCLTSVHAAEASTDPPQHGTFSFYFENDIFGGTDQRYTNGVRLSWTSPRLAHFADEETLGRLGSVLDDMPWIGASGFERNVAFTLGQAMYTPTDILRTDLITEDRPYAGWLYAGLGLIWKNGTEKNSLVLNIGVVGPWSYAQETQRLVHEAKNIITPRGWDNQLHNELGVALAYEHVWRLRPARDNSGWDWDLLPYAGATVGNVAINARLGAEVRLGWNLPDDFGTAAIDPATTTPAPVESVGSAKLWRHKLGAHVFLRAEGRAVAHDIFLDGNTFGNSHSVDKEPFVGDLAAGVSINWKNTVLTYSYVMRSKEFKGQEDEQLFGSLTLGWTF